MTKLTHTSPEILSEQHHQDEVILSINIPANLDYFKGHFPDAPVLAGVVQLNWAIEFAQQKLSLAQSDVENVEVLKFKHLTVPEQKLTLTLIKKNSHKFTFNYSSNKGVHASGRVVLKNKG